MRKLFIVCCLALMALAAKALEVNNLRTQAYVNPIGIDIQQPRFSWMMQADQRGTVQQSYNIRVATDAAMSQVVWQSGEVASRQSVDVEATGFTLQPMTRYYWQVTVADNHGATATSTEKAYFETGLLTEQAWGATKWIKATTSMTTPGEEEEVTDYEVEVKFEIKSLAAGLIFAAKDHNNYYMWQVNTLTGSPRFRPHRWQNGGAACLEEKNLNISLKNNEVHTLRVEVTGGKTAKAYIDGALIDTRTGDFAYGDFGFREDYDNGNVPEQAYFDDFKVTSGG
ncbi:MAG: alpha-rhamnosidase, partial [Bacteroidaceae bacterium]|nr:alpha-rhamnosidase [Bacteroidaceae bacterium]